MLYLRKLSGQFYRNANGTTRYEIYKAETDWLSKIGKILENRFGFTFKDFLDGLDVYYIDYSQADIEITLGWDCWSGCFITTFVPTEEAQKAVREIGLYLDEILDFL